MKIPNLPLNTVEKKFIMLWEGFSPGGTEKINCLHKDWYEAIITQWPFTSNAVK